MSTIINATTTNGVVIQPDNSGSLQLATNSGTTAVTISTAQNVGIGTASPTGKLQVNGAGGVSGSTNLVYVNVTSSFGGISVNSTANNNSFVELLEAGTKVGGFNADTTNNVTSIQSAGGHALAFNVANTTEVGRFSTGGLLSLVAKGTPTDTDFVLQVYADGTTGGVAVQTNQTSGRAAVRFRNPNGIVGQIETSGSSTSYATSSDYRLKENIAPMTGALAVVGQLKPCTYIWKSDGSDGQGFIAHELAEVVPDCVTGEKDAVDEEGNPKYQGIDTSFLVATLTAAIQELKAIVDAQAIRIETLEAK